MREHQGGAGSGADPRQRLAEPPDRRAIPSTVRQGLQILDLRARTIHP